MTLKKISLEGYLNARAIRRPLGLVAGRQLHQPSFKPMARGLAHQP